MFVSQNLMDYAQAVYAYLPADHANAGGNPVVELTFDKSDIIQIVRKDESGWWEGIHLKSGRRGMFPQNYTVPYSGPVARPMPIRMGNGPLAGIPNQLQLRLGVRAKSDGSDSASPVAQQQQAMPNHFEWNDVGVGIGIAGIDADTDFSTQTATPAAFRPIPQRLATGHAMNNAVPMSMSMFTAMGESDAAAQPMSNARFTPAVAGMIGSGQNANDGSFPLSNRKPTNPHAAVNPMKNQVWDANANVNMKAKMNNFNMNLDTMTANNAGRMEAAAGDMKSIAKPAGGTDGHRETRRPNGPTFFGPWASLLAAYTALLYAVCGSGLLIWSVFGNAPPTSDRRWTMTDGIAGGYAVLIGVSIAFYEFFCTSARTFSGGFPHRCWIYLLLPVPGYAMATLLTVLGGCVFLVPCLAFFLAGLKKEYHQPHSTSSRSDSSSDDSSSCGRRLYELVGGVNPEGRVGRIIFLLMYFSANIAIGVSAFLAYQQVIAAAQAAGKDSMTEWVSFAKVGGWIMDFNYTILLVPVAHSFIRYLYNLSTLDQTCASRFWRAVLFCFPLDQALAFHKMCAIMGAIFALEHTIAHVINYGARAALVWSTYGITVWISGVALLALILLMYPAAHAKVKRGQFEIFWYTHMLWPLFIFFNLIHGQNTIGPNYWKYLIAPGSIYFMERLYRFKKEREPVCLVSATFMTNEVLILSLNKEGALASYKEGQYAFICCPNVSAFQWHPMTISSAPQESLVTFHIRVQGPGSWTRGVCEYLRMLSGNLNVKDTRSKQAFAEFHRMDQATGRVLPGKYVGPDNTALLRVYGPNSAPTQHIGEYNSVMVCASGIGVTPLSSTMKSIAFFKWKYCMGRAFPDEAAFYWVTSHRELRSFRWFIRTVKDVDDQIHDLRVKCPDAMRNKFFHFHFYLTSIQSDSQNVDRDFDSYAQKYQNMTLSLEEDTEFWGQKLKEAASVQHESAPWDEPQLYSALVHPPKSDVTMGNVTVHVGRPNWPNIFADTARRSREKHVGVTFCGNPGIGQDLKNCCNQFTRNGDKTFHLHQEVF